MTITRKSATVPYSAEEMYALVNDVESYPSFLPWCSDARVTAREETGLQATISLEIGKLSQTFSTQNTMEPGRRISVELLRGPFRHLHGHWQFEPQPDRGSTVHLEMDFEFKNKVLKLALEKGFNLIANSLVDAFTARAREVYGTR